MGSARILRMEWNQERKLANGAEEASLLYSNRLAGVPVLRRDSEPGI